MDNAFLGYASDILADTDNGLTGMEIIRYCNRYAVDYNIKIPVDNTEMFKSTYRPHVPNKRTALLRNLLAFNKEQQFKIIDSLCELPKLKDQELVKELKVKLITRFPELNIKNEDFEKKIAITTQDLKKYSKCLAPWNSALEKYHSGVYERNLLDDMRLALEILLKEILRNDKSLENQISFVGTALKERNISPEINTLFVKLIDFYSKYQNNYVKHNDAVKSNEIDLIMNQTIIIMDFLTKNIG